MKSFSKGEDIKLCQKTQKKKKEGRERNGVGRDRGGCFVDGPKGPLRGVKWGGPTRVKTRHSDVTFSSWTSYITPRRWSVIRWWMCASGLVSDRYSTIRFLPLLTPPLPHVIEHIPVTHETVTSFYVGRGFVRQYGSQVRIPGLKRWPTLVTR